MTIKELIAMTSEILFHGKPCCSVNTTFNPRAKKADRIFPEALPEGYIYLDVWIHAVDVDDGTVGRIGMGQIIHEEEVALFKADDFVVTIKDQLLFLMMHEAHEGYEYKGVRIHNPHRILGLYVEKVGSKAA